MVRLIDADLLKSYIHTETKSRISISVLAVKGCINNTPTVDAVPVIRCKDCKHYDGRPCGIVDWYNTADDFCSKAERKDNG